MGGSSEKADVSQPVTVTTSEAAVKSRETQLASLRRQGMQSTLLSQQDGGGNSTVGARTLLGGQ
jgi:hypothetical protein